MQYLTLSLRDNDTYSVHVVLFAQSSREHLIHHCVAALRRLDSAVFNQLTSRRLRVCVHRHIGRRKRVRARVYLARSRVNDDHVRLASSLLLLFSLPLCLSFSFTLSLSLSLPLLLLFVTRAFPPFYSRFTPALLFTLVKKDLVCRKLPRTYVGLVVILLR